MIVGLFLDGPKDRVIVFQGNLVGDAILAFDAGDDVFRFPDLEADLALAAFQLDLDLEIDA